MRYTPPDHIGWTLWQATQIWRANFVERMVAEGHAWFAQARGNLIVHIGPEGVRQGDLVTRTGLTKQAVQQFIDELVAEGIVMRTRDETDARARWVRMTPKGEAAIQDADRIKAEIEAHWRDLLGPEAFDQLDSLLRHVIRATAAKGPHTL